MESDYPSHHIWEQREEGRILGSALMDETGDLEATVASEIIQE